MRICNYYYCLDHNFAQEFLSLPYHSHSIFLLPNLQCFYVDSANHHGELAQFWCCSPSTTLSLCHSWWHAQWILLQPQPCCKQRNKWNDRNLQLHHLHFCSCSSLPSTSIMSADIDHPKDASTKQTPHLCLQKPLHLKFPPSTLKHSLPLSTTTLFPP